MCEEKCRRPCLYTRSKSECRSSRAERGKLAPACNPGCLSLPTGASVLTSSLFFTMASSIQLPVLSPALTDWVLATGNRCTVGELIAETRLDCNALASLGPATRQHSSAVLRLHTSPEPVLFRALAFVGLKCTFRHRKSLLLIESAG